MLIRQTDNLKNFNFMPCVKKPLVVHAGDYLIKGVDGEYYICSKSIFEKTYNFEVGGSKCTKK